MKSVKSPNSSSLYFDSREDHESNGQLGPFPALVYILADKLGVDTIEISEEDIERAKTNSLNVHFSTNGFDVKRVEVNKEPLVPLGYRPVKVETGSHDFRRKVVTWDYKNPDSTDYGYIVMVPENLDKLEEINFISEKLKFSDYRAQHTGQVEIKDGNVHVVNFGKDEKEEEEEKPPRDILGYFFGALALFILVVTLIFGEPSKQYKPELGTSSGSIQATDFP